MAEPTAGAGARSLRWPHPRAVTECAPRPTGPHSAMRRHPLRNANRSVRTLAVGERHDRELIRLVGRRTITLEQGRVVEVA